MGQKHDKTRGHNEEARLEKFCAYCRRVLKNANTDVLRAQSRRAKRMTLFSDLSEADLNRLSCPFAVGVPETDFEVCGRRVVVLGAELADAIRELPDEERAAVLLYYFAGWNDRRIAAELGFSRSTAQFRRSVALLRLREALGEGACLDDYL